MTTNNNCTTALQDRRIHREEMLRRLKAVLKNPVNQVCSECPERKPTWAILLEPAVEGGMKMGALCCFNCYSYHFRLGKSICTVKSAKMASEWTDEEVQILERSGNIMVNSIYEAFLEFPKAEKDNLKTFVENKYLHRDFFSEQSYHEQTTIRDVSRRVSKQYHRSSQQQSGGGRNNSISHNNHNDHHHQQQQQQDQQRSSAGSSHDRSGTLDKSNSRRPTLQRSASKRSSRFVLQNMSDHLHHSKHSRSNEREEDDHPADHHHHHHHKVRRPSARSRSRDRLLAMSDHAKRSSRNLTLERTASGCSSSARRRGPPGREDSTQDDLQAMSDHVNHASKRSRSSSRSRDRLRAMSDHLQSATTRSPKPTSSSSRRPRGEKKSPKSPSSGHKRHDSDFIPPKPRRSFHDSELPRRDNMVRASKSSVRRAKSFKLERIEKSIGGASTIKDDHQDDMDYDLPKYLAAGNRICPSDLDISDISGNTRTGSGDLDDSSMSNHHNHDDDDVVDITKKGKESSDTSDARTGGPVNQYLAAYMKRYRQSRSREDNENAQGEFKFGGASTTTTTPAISSNPMPLRAALESLETTILSQPVRAPMIHNGDKTAYWQAKLAPLATEDDQVGEFSPQQAGKALVMMVESPIPSPIPRQISTSGRAA